jgi:hypothetical protein
MLDIALSRRVSTVESRKIVMNQVSPNSLLGKYIFNKINVITGEHMIFVDAVVQEYEPARDQFGQYRARHRTEYTLQAR